jgi:hypothetical protein
MDYPHPVEKLTDDGGIDLSGAYPQHIGDWDKVAIAYGYTEYPQGKDDATAMAKVLNDGWEQDLRYLTNQDTDIHPRADQWSNGVNQADELNHMMKVRRAALNRMGEQTIRTGAMMSTIEEPLAPIYMYHRYAVESASSMIAGQDFIYAVRGDGRAPTRWEAAADQRKALEALAATLKPSELTIPKKLLDLIPPRPPGFGFHRELFPRTTGEAFDPINPASIASDVTIGFILENTRAARMVAQHAEDPNLPGLGEVIDRLVKATVDAATATPYEAEVRRAEERVLVDRLTWLADSAANAQVRAIASQRLQSLASRFRTAAADESEQAQRTLLAADIKRFLERPAAEGQKLMPPSPAPPGAPIGDMSEDWMFAPPQCGFEWWQQP